MIYMSEGLAAVAPIVRRLVRRTLSSVGTHVVGSYLCDSFPLIACCVQDPLLLSILQIMFQLHHRVVDSVFKIWTTRSSRSEHARSKFETHFQHSTICRAVQTSIRNCRSLECFRLNPQAFVIGKTRDRTILDKPRSGDFPGASFTPLIIALCKVRKPVCSCCARGLFRILSALI